MCVCGGDDWAAGLNEKNRLKNGVFLQVATLLSVFSWKISHPLKRKTKAVIKKTKKPNDSLLWLKGVILQPSLFCPKCFSAVVSSQKNTLHSSDGLLLSLFLVSAARFCGVWGPIF